MEHTRKQADRINARLKWGFVVAATPPCMTVEDGNVSMVSRGECCDLYIVIDRQGKTVDRKFMWKRAAA